MEKAVIQQVISFRDESQIYDRDDTNTYCICRSKASRRDEITFGN